MSVLQITFIMLNVTVPFVIVACSVDGANFSFVNPTVIYKNISVNWFGAVLLTIVANILLPAVAIPYWIYKLCTIGRK